MGYIWKSLKLNSAVLSCTIGIFTLSTITPLQALPQNPNGINFNEIGFALRIEKLIEKLNKYRDRKDEKGLLEVMFDIKMEVEGYTGQKIDIQKSLDKVEKDVKAKGGKIDQKVMKKLRKNFSNQEKRIGHKANYMATCLEYNLPYNTEEENFIFENNLLMSKNGAKEENDQEICIPLRVTIGVTVTLCGFFLLIVPIPICKQYAPFVIETGMAFLVDEGITQWEDKNKK